MTMSTARMPVVDLTLSDDEDDGDISHVQAELASKWHARKQPQVLDKPSPPKSPVTAPAAPLRDSQSIPQAATPSLRSASSSVLSPTPAPIAPPSRSSFSTTTPLPNERQLLGQTLPAAGSQVTSPISGLNTPVARAESYIQYPPVGFNPGSGFLIPSTLYSSSTNQYAGQKRNANGQFRSWSYSNPSPSTNQRRGAAQSTASPINRRVDLTTPQISSNGTGTAPATSRTTATRSSQPSLDRLRDVLISPHLRTQPLPQQTNRSASIPISVQSTTVASPIQTQRTQSSLPPSAPAVHSGLAGTSTAVSSTPISTPIVTPVPAPRDVASSTASTTPLSAPASILKPAPAFRSDPFIVTTVPTSAALNQPQASPSVLQSREHTTSTDQHSEAAKTSSTTPTAFPRALLPRKDGRQGPPIAREFVLYPYRVSHLSERVPRSEMAWSKENEVTRRLVAAMGTIFPSDGAITFTEPEKALLKHLKEDLGLSWNDIWSYFPHRRSWHQLQGHYSKVLKDRNPVYSTTSSLPTHPVPAQDSTQPLEVPLGVLSLQSRGREQSAFAEETPYDEARSLRARRSTRIDRLGLNQPGTFTLRPEMFGPPELNEEASSSDEEMVDDAHESELVRETYTRVSRYMSGTQGTLSTIPKADQIILERGTYLRARSLRDSAYISSGLHRIHREPQQVTLAEKRRLGLPKDSNVLQKRTSIELTKPYLSIQEREILEKSIQDGLWDVGEAKAWDASIIHVDFTDSEIKSICSTLAEYFTIPAERVNSKERLATTLRPFSKEKFQKLAEFTMKYGPYMNRNVASISAFLQDLQQRKVASATTLKRICNQSYPRVARSGADAVLRERELGSGANRGVRYAKALYNSLASSYGPALTFEGMSGDVNISAWSPEGSRFCLGAAALTDDSSMQYNGPNNLLYGDLQSKTVYEMPTHSTPRRPASGINTTHAMQASQEPLLFHTISSLAFSGDGSALFTGGLDNCVRVWDVNGPIPRMRWAMRQHAHVDLIAVHPTAEIFAIGTKVKDAPVRLYKYGFAKGQGADFDTNHLKIRKYTIRDDVQQADRRYEPDALRWGPRYAAQDKYLLGGFSIADRELGGGMIQVWDVDSQVSDPVARIPSKVVFDAQWHPSVFGRFVVGMGAGHSVNRGTRSVVRVHDSFRQDESSPLRVSTRCTIELECPAIDMNDVVLNDVDPNLVAVGCTDGKTYVWDLRKPDSLLHTLAHGESLMPLDVFQPAEQVDTGVRMVLWGESQRRLYTGSSDGVVACWDPYRSPEDAHVQTVTKLKSGVMSGAFSPDYTNLLLGEVTGNAHVLSLGREDATFEDAEPFKYVEAIEEKGRLRKFDFFQPSNANKGDVQNTSGLESARELIKYGEIKIMPAGNLPKFQAVQGPQYSGPYDEATDAEILREAALKFQESLRPSDNLCQLDHAIPIGTEEDFGDAGNWKHRIPGNIAEQLQRLAIGEVRCEIDCFRCGLGKKLVGVTVKGASCLECASCGYQWRPDILGYKLVGQSAAGLLRTQNKIQSWPPAYGQQSLTEKELLQDHQGGLVSRWGST